VGALQENSWFVEVEWILALGLVHFWTDLVFETSLILCQYSHIGLGIVDHPRSRQLHVLSFTSFSHLISPPLLL
jgi:hypothetical protein